MLEEFLTRFYETISFSAGEPFPAGGFRGLFRPDALLLERTEAGYASRTVEEHIREFEEAVRERPQLFAAGFRERQTSLEWTGQNGVYLVHSGYEKRYARSGAMVTERGVNHLTIVCEGGELHVACAVWE